MSKQTTDTDVAFISALAELLNRNELTELSVKREYGEDDSLEVRVVKQANVVTVTAAAFWVQTVSGRLCSSTTLEPAGRSASIAHSTSCGDP